MLEVPRGCRDQGALGVELQVIAVFCAVSQDPEDKFFAKGGNETAVGHFDVSTGLEDESL